MKFKHGKFYMIFVFMYLSSFAYGQSDQSLPEVDGNYEYFLNDGINKGARNVVSLATLNLSGGYFDLRYRRRLGRRYSLETGYAVKMFNGIDLVETVIEKEKIYNTLEDQDEYAKGSGYSFAVKYNPFRKGITEKGFVAMNYRLRTEKYTPFDYSRRDVYFSLGMNQIKKHNIALESSYGLGWRKTMLNYREADGTLSAKLPLVEHKIFFHMDFRIGYYF